MSASDLGAIYGALAGCWCSDVPSENSARSGRWIVNVMEWSAYGNSVHCTVCHANVRMRAQDRDGEWALEEEAVHVCG